MTENKTITIIKKITTSLLEDSLHQDEAVKSLNEIHTHFQQITEITGYDNNIDHLVTIPAAKGTALGLNYAAQCLIDYKRTVKFLKAITTAIAEKQEKNPRELIHIFYAGCGPYATFLALIAPLFTPKEVQFSLLEINKKSIESAKKIINSLELTDYVQEFYLADAVTFKIPNPDTIHILISETLDALLYRECYVPILFNLLPQLNKDIALIPENVVIDLLLIAYSKDNNTFKELNVGDVFNVRETVALYDGNPSLPSELPPKKINLKTLDVATYESMLLDTKVHIYNDIWLDRNESSLTLPLEITLQKPFQNEAIIFTYQLEPTIELKCVFQ